MSSGGITMPGTPGKQRDDSFTGIAFDCRLKERVNQKKTASDHLSEERLESEQSAERRVGETGIKSFLRINRKHGEAGICLYPSGQTRNQSSGI